MDNVFEAKQIMYNELKRIYRITNTIKFEEEFRKADNFISNTVFLDFEDYVYGDELKYIIHGSTDEGGFLTLSAGYDKYEMMYDVDFDLDNNISINGFISDEPYYHWAKLLKIIREDLEKEYSYNENSEEDSYIEW